MELVNLTPFSAERAVFLDGDGRERLLVVVKATYEVEGRVRVAPEQVPIALADVYAGEPATSGLVEASDLAPTKQATDVLLRGCAYTLPSAPSEVLVAMRVGALTRCVRVTGDRTWSFGGLTRSLPEPFAKMELCWERAFGGIDEGRGGRLMRCEENHAGRGFRARGSRKPISGTPLPNLEDPADCMSSARDRPRPAGFGPVAPTWAPRARYAGTHDERWARERFPFLPLDFDPRFHQVAPAGQVYPGFVQGGEPVRVVGATPEGVLDFRLPEVRPEITVRAGRTREAMQCACDTVTLDCEAKRVTLVWRGSQVVHGRVPALRWIRIAAPGLARDA